MTRKLDRTQIAEIARVVAPQASALTVAHPPRTFEMPPILYAVTVAAYLGFVAILATAFATREMILPVAIIAILIIAGFGVPMLWAKMQPDTAARALSWRKFRHRGIVTHSGRMSASDATIQVLILPSVILLWAAVVATIAALT